MWAWVPPGGGTGVANAGVIAEDDGLTVVDTLMVRSQWVPFARAVAPLGRVRRVILTNSHIEHVGGTKAFPMASVYATEPTSDLLDQPMSTDLYKRFMPRFAAEFDDLAEVGTRSVTHLVTDAALLTPRIELLPGAGHSPGDLMVLVDDAEVLFLGGLGYFGVTPLAFQGDPAAWAAVLTTLPDLAETFVPGHGPVGGAADVLALAGYLQACVDAAGDPGSIPPGPWDRWSERDRDAINVERAAMLAGGEGPNSVPPAMLRALGL